MQNLCRDSLGLDYLACTSLSYSAAARSSVHVGSATARDSGVDTTCFVVSGGGGGGGTLSSQTPPTYTPPTIEAPPQPCSVARALAAVPGAPPTGVNTPADGHLEVGVSLTEATLTSNGFTFYQGPFGANGYRRGNVIVSGHVNATSGQLSPSDFYATPDGIVNAQIHFDTFNPATGLFGLIGHTLWDYTVGKTFFRHSAALDKWC
jgi:hypothetical protein